jgi:azurin
MRCAHEDAMTVRRLPTNLRTLSLVASLAAAACGQPEPAPPPGATPAATLSAPQAVVHDGRAIEISANDLMKFDVVEIRAKAGERLSVTLVNKGTMPKLSMGHNWVLLASGVNADTFVAVAGEAPTTDYVPAARKADILAATKLLGPVERDTVTFSAPATAGQYTFLCSFPGHYQVGMKGVLIVE